MSVTLKIDNYPQLNVKEIANLAADVEPGATSLTLLNNEGIEANDILIVGRRGSETGELRTVASITGSTIATTDAITLHHDTYEDISVLFGDQLKIYRAQNVNGTAPDDGSFTLLATVDIDADEMATTYTDNIGNADYWYKYTYYNSTSTNQSDLNQVVAVRGGGAGQYETLDNIRSASGFENNRNITDHYIDGFRRSAQAQINGKLAGIYVVPFVAPINDFISQITKSLAAGHIKLDQFGQNNPEGNSMIKWAEEQLENIRSGKYTLTDEAGNTLPEQNGSASDVPGGGGMGFSGYPNASDQEGGFRFRADDRY